MAEKVYIYCGAGLGVPGLPHRITEGQAAALGLKNQLQAAVKAGQYKLQPASKKKDKKAGDK